jgi:hypothetical protein
VCIFQIKFLNTIFLSARLIFSFKIAFSNKKEKNQKKFQVIKMQTQRKTQDRENRRTSTATEFYFVVERPLTAAVEWLGLPVKHGRLIIKPNNPFFVPSLENRKEISVVGRGRNAIEHNKRQHSCDEIENREHHCTDDVVQTSAEQFCYHSVSPPLVISPDFGCAKQKERRILSLDEISVASVLSQMCVLDPKTTTPRVASTLPVITSKSTKQKVTTTTKKKKHILALLNLLSLTNLAECVNPCNGSDARTSRRRKTKQLEKNLAQLLSNTSPTKTTTPSLSKHEVGFGLCLPTTEATALLLSQ